MTCVLKLYRFIHSWTNNLGHIFRTFARITSFKYQMGKRRRCELVAAKNQIYEIGETVLAKVKGYKAWPAVIIRKPKMNFVKFFGYSES